MSKRAWQIIGIIVLIILILSITYVVDEKNQVFILQMGKAVRTVQQPGLYFKVPWPIQTISTFDNRPDPTSTDARRHHHQGQEETVVGQLRQVADCGSIEVS